MPNLILAEEVYAIAGAGMCVYRNLGRGFLEPVYQEALELEMRLRQIPFKSQPWLSVKYRDKVLEKGYRADLVCYDQIIVELKVVPRLGGVEMSQIINYLKATGQRVGVLLNFGSLGQMEWKRYVI